MKGTYYGKADVIAYRLYRDGRQPAVFGANVKILIYGDAFWPTYTEGDNSALIATDSMKNFIQRETMNFEGNDLESYSRFLVEKFLSIYPQVEGAQVSAEEIPYEGIDWAKTSFVPTWPERSFARVEVAGQETVEARSGIRGFRLLRLNGSAFQGFIRDEYTTLPDIENRPLHMWLDLDWSYDRPVQFSEVRRIVYATFAGFESGSIQQVIYQTGQRLLSELPGMVEVRLEANNQTWDTIAERGDKAGVYTDARPPYGVLALTLAR